MNSVNVVVTGATKGIGRAIAERFHREGANLILCSRKEEDLIKMKEELSSDRPNQSIHIMPCDVSDPDQVKAFGQFALDATGAVDVLVNNAGVFFPGELLAEEEGVLQTMIDTNLYSAYHLTRVIGPEMKKQGSGHIFNMCSVASLMAYPNGGSYSISKFALLGFSKVLREELKAHHVKVTSIMPGATWSNSWAGVDLPPERLMNSEDIADAVWGAYALGPSAVVEDIVIRPQLGDL